MEDFQFGGPRIISLHFTDDVVLLFSSTRDMERSLEHVEAKQ